MGERKLRPNPEIQPEIRPRFNVVQGGGQTSPRQSDLQSVDNPPHESSTSDDLSAQNLSDQENRLGVIQGGGQTSAPAGDLKAVKDTEERGNPNWKVDLQKNDQSSDKKQGRFLGAVKKKGPLGLIIGLVLGGGGGLGLLFSPAGALIHLKEVFVNKLDTMTSVEDARTTVIMSKRLFGTTASCTIKIRCRYSGIKEPEMKRIRASGATLLDANGKEVKKNPVTRRYSGGKTLVLSDGQKVTAQNYKKLIKSSPSVRAVANKIFAAKFMSWNDNVAREGRGRYKLVENPKWGDEGDEKSARKNVYQAVHGENGPAVDVDENRPPPKTDADGKPIPPDQDPGSAGLDLGDDAADIQKEADKLTALAEVGDPVPTLTGDPVEAANLPDYEGGASAAKGLRSVVGFLNPLGFFTGLCTVYQYLNLIVLIAETRMAIAYARLASQLNSTADKVKAGEATGDEVEKAMNMLQKETKSGETFDSSASFQTAQYGGVSGAPLRASLQGNDVVRMMATALHTTNNALGGRVVVRTACNILTNPVVQGALILTNFIPGAGAIGGTLTKILAKGGMAAAKKAITEKIEGAIAKNLTKDALKAASKKALRGLGQLARSPAFALFLGSYLMGKYGIPYIARAISDTSMIDADGPTVADSDSTGLAYVNSQTGQARGLEVMSKAEYKKENGFRDFNTESTATYVADMRAQSNPFDVTDPYSAGNSLASAFYIFGSKVDLLKDPQNLLSAPGAILSSLNPSKLLTSTALAGDIDDELDYCESPVKVDAKVATRPDCNVIPGFHDINMLVNADGEAITQKLADQGQVNPDTGEAIAGSALADFQAACMTDAWTMYIDDLGEEKDQLPERCYDAKENDKTEIKEFRLYSIEKNILDKADEDPTDGEDDAALQANTTNAEPIQDPTDQAIATLTKEMAEEIHDAKVAQADEQKTIEAPEVACANEPSSDSLASFQPFTTPTSDSRYINKRELNYA